MNTLKKGDKLPIFALKDQNGIMHKSIDYQGKKLLSFSIQKQTHQGAQQRFVI